MKLLNVLFLIFLFPFQNQKPDTTIDVSGKEMREMSNTAFQQGEYLKYRIHYGIINAGIAELSVQNKTTKSGREVYHMVGKGRSVGMAEWFFKTRDTYESYVDAKSIVPWEFVRDVNEGGYIIKRHLMFDHLNNTAKDLEQKKPKEYKVPDNVQDLLSTFYYARCVDTRNMKKEDVIPIEIFMDHEVFGFQLKYLGKESIKSEWGNIECKKFIPLVQEGRVFAEEEGLTLWVSDDENKIPMRLEAELAVGSIKMDLMDYRNNRHPLQFK